MARRATFFAATAALLFAAVAPALPEKAAPQTIPKPESPAAVTLARIAGLAGDWGAPPNGRERGRAAMR